MLQKHYVSPGVIDHLPCLEDIAPNTSVLSLCHPPYKSLDSLASFVVVVFPCYCYLFNPLEFSFVAHRLHQGQSPSFFRPRPEL